MMTQIGRNIIANFVGQIWTVVVSIVFIPIYIHFLGIEAYGLIGFYTSLFVVLGVLDLGLGGTVNREMARLSVHPDKSQEMRNLVRTIEIIYWSVAIVIGVTVFSLSDFFANYWLQASQLSPKTIEQAIKVMGVTFALQWPISLYSAGLSGLQHQVLLNFIVVGIATVRALGAILILWFISSTIQSFFFWQAAVNLLQVILVVVILWRHLPIAEKRPYFQSSILKNIWRFSAGISGILVFYTVISSMDKIVLSKLVSLEMFGYYALAGVVAAGLTRIAMPIYQAVWPRFTQLVTQRDYEGLKSLYHRSSQLMSVILLPVAMIIAFFPNELLLLWTRNSQTAEFASTILCFLTIGMAFNGMIYMPVALQYAYGWTKLFFLTNLIAVIVMVPLIYLMVSNYGAVGAAMVWVMLNCGYFFIMVMIMHRRLLRGEQWRWYLQDCGVPFLVVIFIVGVGRLLLPKLSNGYMLINIGLLLILSASAALLASPEIKKTVLGIVINNRKIR
jgi:O-antigen/teichoic acid export membrane protein